MEIQVVQGNILDADTEALVNPANSSGKMGGGVARIILEGLGYVVQEEAVSKSPIPVGGAAITSGGSSRFRAVIHAPTMEKPVEPTTAEKVEAAMTAAINLAEEEGIHSMTVPGMGAGTGKVSPADAAAAMFRAVDRADTKQLYRIVFMDVNPEMVRAWEMELESRAEN